jgi:hypothetical protein
VSETQDNDDCLALYEDHRQVYDRIQDLLPPLRGVAEHRLTTEQRAELAWLLPEERRRWDAYVECQRQRIVSD